MKGADLVCEVLASYGVRHVFGLPGTQNVGLYDALRRSRLRSVVAADEGGAAFMAAGYARATGDVAVVTTIPGPGFVYALPGIVEALHDSTPLLWLTLRQADTGRAFQLQRVDQAAMAAPAVKHCVHVDRIEMLGQAIARACLLATSGEPGPVLLEIDAPLLELEAPSYDVPAQARMPRIDVQSLVSVMTMCKRPVIYVGQGAQGASDAVRSLARKLNAPVLCTSSGRGVLPDTDRLALVRDFSTGVGNAVPEVIERCDLILALGCKFSHNGSAGARLSLPESKLVRVDASAEVLAANYPAKLAIEGRVEDVLAALDGIPLPVSVWSDGELRTWRERLEVENSAAIAHEPLLPDTATGTLRSFFSALAKAAGDEAIYVTDAGLHQALTRRYAVVSQPRGLLCPNDFQSMGFGLPGAIGAAIARPEARVIACIGDGALVLSMGELLTAAREGVELVIIVFNDGQMNLIRRQQLTNYGHEAGVAVANPDYAALAAAVGCSYFRVSGDVAHVVRQVIESRGVRLVELRLADQSSLEWQRLKAIVREGVRARLPESTVRTFKRLLGR